MDIRELVEENRELRETLLDIQEMIHAALSTSVLTVDDTDLDDEDEVLED